MIVVEKSEHDRRMVFARQKAAQCWCDPETGMIEMDSRLAEAFAKRLVVEMYESRLGCATTAEMLTELAARAEMGGYAEYRTIGNGA